MTINNYIIEPKKKLTTKSKEIIDNIVVKEKKSTKTKETNDDIDKLFVILEQKCTSEVDLDE